MIKTEGSVMSNVEGGMREDFLFTYDERDRQKNLINENNAGLIFKADFYPLYTEWLGKGFSLEELVLISFFKYRTQSGPIYATNEQLGLLIGKSPDVVRKLLNGLKEKEILLISQKPLIGGGTDRKIAYNANPTGMLKISTHDCLKQAGKKIYKRINNTSSNIPEVLLKEDGQCAGTQLAKGPLPKYIKQYEDIKEIKDDEYLRFYRVAIKCVMCFIDLGYKIEKNGEELDNFIEWLKSKAKLYNIMLPSGEINWGDMLRRVDTWKDRYQDKGRKPKNYKTSLKPFISK